MTVVKGDIRLVTNEPAAVSQVWVRAPKPRTQGLSYVSESSDTVQVDNGVVEFTVLPGAAVMVLVQNGVPTDTVKLIVPDKETASLRECIDAVGLVDDGTLSALEELALETAGTAAQIASAGQLDTWANETASAAAQARLDRNEANRAANRAATHESNAKNAESNSKQHEESANSAAQAASGYAASAANDVRDELSDIANDAQESATQAKTSETNAKMHEDNSVAAAERAEFAAEETIQQVEGDFATRNYVDNSAWARRYILSNENLNSITTPGVYQIPYGSTMSSLANRPIGYTSNGFLIVYASLGTVFQVLTQNTPRGSVSVKRNTRDGTFGEWESADGVTQIFHYSDYNDAIIEGDYDIDTFAKARDVANRPPEVPSSLRLSVRKIGGGRIYQLIIGTSPDGVAEKWERRRAADSTWSAWSQVHTDVSKDWVNSRIEEIGESTKSLDHVVTVGDSQVGASYAWANKLAGISDLTVVNRGVGGYTPDEALIAAGAWETEVEQDVELPPSTDVPVVLKKYPVVAKNRTRVWVGEIDGSSVELKYVHDADTFALRNRGTSTVPVIARAKWTPGNYRELSDHRRIVWFGGNAIRSGLHGAGQTVLEHVQTAYSQALEAWGATTIVCGYVPAHGDSAGRDVANALNAWLERVVPNQFLDIRKRLQNDAPAVLGRGLTASETQDISNGYLPQAMYQSDLVHLTEETHVRIAEIVAGFPHGASPQVSIRSNPNSVVSLTGAGSPEGRIAASVGSIYMDTAATSGAIRWIKANGTGKFGWRVEYGDTGWRNVTSLLSNGWTAEQVLLRRQNSTVILSALNLSATNATSGMFISLPGAFHTPKTFVMMVTPTGSRPAFWNLSLGLTVSDYSNFGTSTYASTQTTWQVESDRAWPTSLPGTPA